MVKISFYHHPSKNRFLPAKCQPAHEFMIPEYRVRKLLINQLLLICSVQVLQLLGKLITKVYECTVCVHPTLERTASCCLPLVVDSICDQLADWNCLFQEHEL